MLSPIPPSWCPWWRTSPPSPVMAPSTTTLPTVLPSLSAAVPATFLGISHLAVSQRLGSSIDGRSVKCRYGKDDESRRTKRRENVAHPSNSSRPKVGTLRVPRKFPAQLQRCGSLIAAANNPVTCSAANPGAAQSICPSSEPTIPRGVCPSQEIDRTSTMLPPNNLSYDREAHEPKTAFLFGLAVGAVVPLLVLAVSA